MRKYLSGCRRARRLPAAPRPQRDLARATKGSSKPLRRRRYRSRAVRPEPARVPAVDWDNSPRTSRTSQTNRLTSACRGIKPAATCYTGTSAHGRYGGVDTHRLPVPLRRLERLEGKPWIADEPQGRLGRRSGAFTRSMESLIPPLQVSSTEVFRVRGPRSSVAIDSADAAESGCVPSLPSPLSTAGPKPCACTSAPLSFVDSRRRRRADETRDGLRP